jgi:hypothetical protein
MFKDSSRRIFLRIIPGAIAGVVAFRAFAQAPPVNPGTQPPPKPMPPPKDGDGNALPGFGSNSGSAGSSNSSNSGMHGAPPRGSRGVLPDVPEPDPKLLKTNETGMRHDIIKLAELAQELKKQVEDTDSTKVLSLDLIKKTQEIERLAHQIATLAKG